METAKKGGIYSQHSSGSVPVVYLSLKQNKSTFSLKFCLNPLQIIEK